MLMKCLEKIDLETEFAFFGVFVFPITISVVNLVLQRRATKITTDTIYCKTLVQLNKLR